MSLPVEQLDIKTVNRLDILKTVESPQGLDKLFLQKLLNLVYLTNDLQQQTHTLGSRSLSDITAAGASFTSPINVRRLVFSIFVTLTTTATVGSRQILFSVRTKADNNFFRFMTGRAVAASTTETYQVGPYTASSGATISIESSYPIHLEPEWKIIIDDTSDIDNADDVAWDVDYVEVPI